MGWLHVRGRSAKRNGSFSQEKHGSFGADDAAVLSVLSVGCVSADSCGKIRMANTQALKDLGMDGDDLRGKDISETVPIYNGSRNILPELLQRLEKGEASLELSSNTYLRKAATGEKFFIRGQLLGDYRKGRLRRVAFLFRDIESELTREYILNMALSRTKIFPWFFDMDLNKMIIDVRWFVHLGYPAGDGMLTADEFAVLVHPDDRDMLLGALARQLSGTLNKDLFEYRLKRADGTWEWFEERSVYLGKVDNTPYRIVGVCQSIQDHKTVEDSLMAARDKAQESDRLKSAFLANMSHEIRTPLNAIVGFSNLLTDPEILLEEDETKEYVRLINLNSAQLLVLISDILDLSRIESNTMEFVFSSQSLNALLSDIYQSQVLNMPGDVELLTELPETDVCLSTDPMRLKQVVNNLINNAVKFTPRGSIRFGYRLAADAKSVELFVRDTGKGMTEDQQTRIFERFYKADTFTNGAGLGLSICKTILERLGGSISVSSKEGAGTCFTVCLPVA